MHNTTGVSESRPSALDDQLPGFSSWLEKRGYSASTVAQYGAICRRLGSYLEGEGIAADAPLELHVNAFLGQVEPRRKGGRKDALAQYYGGACRRLLEYLREIGLAPRPSVPPNPAVIEEYLRFLRDHRAVTESTIESHERHLGRFLAHAGVKGDTHELRRLSLDQVDRFLVEATSQLKRTSVNHVCAAVRGFLRYLHMRGVLDGDVSSQVATPRIYALETLPRAIDWRDVERTLACVERGTRSGCRDYAILVLLAYCGLRACEVAALRLDDLDWRHDTIHVRRTKRDTVDAIPLVPIVGEALVEYLKRRGESSRPEVFLKLIAPSGPMNTPCISFIVRKYLLVAGVKTEHFGAHTLRHSYAVELLRRGFPLKTIGDTLGHRNAQSTFIYTKAAVEDLRSVALETTEVLP